MSKNIITYTSTVVILISYVDCILIISYPSYYQFFTNNTCIISFLVQSDENISEVPVSSGMTESNDILPKQLATANDEDAAENTKPTIHSILEKLKAQVQQQLDSVVGYETSTASEPDESDWLLEDANYPFFEFEPVSESDSDAPISEFSTYSSPNVVEVISSIKNDKDWAVDDDPEIGENDRWECVHCKRLNSPIARNCDFCWKLRENWLPSDENSNAVDTSNDIILSPISENDSLERSTAVNNTVNFNLMQESDSSGSDSHVDSPVISSKRNSRLKSRRTKKHRKISHQLKKYRAASNKRLNPIDGMCMICLSEPKSASIIHINEGVGHQVCCYDCAEKLRRRRKPCPICRRPIELIVQNFIS